MLKKALRRRARRELIGELGGYLYSEDMIEGLSANGIVYVTEYQQKLIDKIIDMLNNDEIEVDYES